MEKVQENINEETFNDAMDLASRLESNKIIKTEENKDEITEPEQPENEENINPPSDRTEQPPEEPEEVKPKRGPGRPAKNKTTTTTTPKKTTTSHLRNLFSGVDKVYVFKVIEEGERKGKEKFIRQYNPNELLSYSNLEQFVKENIAGDQGGTFRLMVANPAKSDEYKQIKEVIVEGQPLQAITKNEGVTTKDFGDMIKAIMTVQQAAEEKSNKQMEKMVQLLTLTQKQNQQPQQQSTDLTPILLMMMNQDKGSDPTSQILLTMLTKMMEKIEDKSTSLPPIPPFAPIKEDNKSSEMIELLKTLIESNNQNQQQPLSDKIMEKFFEDKEDKILDRLIKMRELAKPTHESTSQLGDALDTIVKLEEIKDKIFNKDGGLLENLTEIAAGIIEKIPAQRPQTQQIQQTKQKLPKIPRELKKYLIELNKSIRKGDEKKAIESFLNSILFLRQHDKNWNILFEQFVNYTHSEEKDKAINILETFLNTFVAKLGLNREVADEVKDLIEENWEDILIALGFKQKEESEEETETNEKTLKETEDKEGVTKTSVETINEQLKTVETEDEDDPVELIDVEKRKVDIEQKEDIEQSTNENVEESE